MKRRHFLSLLGAAPVMAAAGTRRASAQGLLGTANLAQTALPVWEAWKTAYLLSLIHI